MESTTQPTEPKRRRFLSRIANRVFLVLALCILFVYGWYRYKFPYGYSHCCIALLTLTLSQYADEHDGKYPFGQKTPEASLSLLAKGDYGINAYTLSGKTVSPRVSEAALKKDGFLGPESCGWHYVEGLTTNDEYSIAIIWDKIGLGHNGERLENGGHEVGYLDGSHNYVSAADWPAFLEKQKRLLANRQKPKTP